MCIDIFSTVIPKLTSVTVSKINLEDNEFIYAALILFLKCFMYLKFNANMISSSLFLIFYFSSAS